VHEIDFVITVKFYTDTRVIFQFRQKLSNLTVNFLKHQSSLVTGLSLNSVYDQQKRLVKKMALLRETEGSAAGPPGTNGGGYDVPVGE
jgi:hypothetical protein